MKKAKTTWSLWALTAAVLSLTACSAGQSDILSDCSGREPNVPNVFVGGLNILAGGSESPPGSSIQNSAESTIESTAHSKPNVADNENRGEMSGIVMVLNDGADWCCSAGAIWEDRITLKRLTCTKKARREHHLVNIL